jgi:hypothetical protein
MRLPLIAAPLIALAWTAIAAPAHAAEEIMWCKATAETATYYSAVFTRAEDETGDPAAAFRGEIVAKYRAGAQTQAACYGADSEAAAQAAIDADARAARAAGRAVVTTDWRF